jgi:hypothetical protein
MEKYLSLKINNLLLLFESFLVPLLSTGDIILDLNLALFLLLLFFLFELLLEFSVSCFLLFNEFWYDSTLYRILFLLIAHSPISL